MFSSTARVIKSTNFQNELSGKKHQIKGPHVSRVSHLHAIKRFVLERWLSQLSSQKDHQAVEAELTQRNMKDH